VGRKRNSSEQFSSEFVGARGARPGVVWGGKKGSKGESEGFGKNDCSFGENKYDRGKMQSGCRIGHRGNPKKRVVC